MNFKKYMEAHWYAGQEYRLGSSKHPNIDQLFKDIAAREGDPSKILISNTVYNKIGINPRTTNRTPVGQYFYPLDYVMKIGFEHLPWGGGRQYAVVAKLLPGANVLVMTTAGAPDVQSIDIATYDFPYKDKLIQRAGGFENFKKIYDQYFVNRGWTAKSNHSILWVVTYGISSGEKPENSSEPMYGHGTGRNYRVHLSERMTGIFVSMGIDGFYDTGTGTIHPNEKHQCLMFNLGKVRSITTVDLTSSKPKGFHGDTGSL